MQNKKALLGNIKARDKSKKRFLEKKYLREKEIPRPKKKNNRKPFPH